MHGYKQEEAVETEVPIHDEPATSQARTTLVPLDRCGQAHPACLPLLRVRKACMWLLHLEELTRPVKLAAAPPLHVQEMSACIDAHPAG